MSFMETPDQLIAFGSAVKFLDEAKTRVGGYLVRYSGPKDPDLYGDFFTKGTDFGHDELDGLKLRLYYDHGFDGNFKSTPIGSGSLKADDAGLWFEAQLKVSDDYIAAVRELIDEGRLGYSSGAVGHLVERKSMGSVAEITRWPLGEASLTPRPAEPRNVVSLKALIDAYEQANAEAKPETKAEADAKSAPSVADGAEPAEQGAAAPETPHPADRQSDMEKETKNTDTTGAPQFDAEAAYKRIEDRLAALQADQKKSAETTARNPEIEVKAPVVLKAGLGDNQTKAFVHWVRTGDQGAVKNMIVGDNPMGPVVEIKASNATDMNIGTAADGGNTVTDDMFAGIIRRRDEAMLAGKLGVRRFTGTGTTLDVPTDDEADGEFVTKSEATAFDQDSPAIGQTVLTLVKYTKYTDISHELLQDSMANIEEFLADFVGRGMAKTHNNLLITESVANGSELTKTASTTALALGELEAAMYNNDLADYLDDAGSVGWVMKPATYAKILSLGGTSNRYYAETAQGTHTGPTVLGSPVHFSQKVDAYGTANNRFAHFANWNAYMGLYEYPGLQFLRNPYIVANSGQVRLHWYFRCDYGVLQSEAGGFVRHITT